MPRVPGRVSKQQRCPGLVEVCNLGRVAADLHPAASLCSLLCFTASLYSWLPPPRGFCLLLTSLSPSAFTLSAFQVTSHFSRKKVDWQVSSSHLLKTSSYVGMAFLEVGQAGQVPEQNRFLSKAVG